ncbi:hypothetical protein ACSQ67_014442 [Phaseolus vulgaris]
MRMNNLAHGTTIFDGVALHCLQLYLCHFLDFSCCVACFNGEVEGWRGGGREYGSVVFNVSDEGEGFVHL